MMILRAFVMVSLVGLCCRHVAAQVPCPWITEGTAATALGGTPEVAVNVVSAQEGSCVFTLANAVTRFTLAITVSTQPPSSPELSCPVNSRSLAGIGNSAVICHIAAALPGDRLRVLSRVRGVYFSIDLTAARKDAGVGAAESEQNAITMIAEQVAGSLF